MLANKNCLPAPSAGVFASVASAVRATGKGGEFASALLLTAAICAMLSTADSSLIAFSTMWLRDFYLPYVNPGASAKEQLVFTRIMGVFGLAIGLFLTSMSIRSAQVSVCLCVCVFLSVCPCLCLCLCLCLCFCLYLCLFRLWS